MEAIKSHSIPIGKLTKVINNGEIFVKALLIKVVTDVVRFFNVGKTMSDQQVVQTVDLIYQEYNFFKFEDFKLCFDRAKKGHYGKTYDRIDGQIIFEWLTLYSNERALEAEQIGLKEHSLKKAERVDPSEINPEGQKKVIEILKSVLEPKPESELVKPLKWEKSPRDQFIQKCMTEFDEIVSLKPSVDEFGMQIPGRYTDMEITDTIGFDKIKKKPITKTHVRPIDVTDYLKIKVSEYDLNQKH